MKRIVPALKLDEWARLTGDLSGGLPDAADDLVAVATAYAESGAAELLIDARQTDIQPLAAVVARVAAALSIPLSLRFDPARPAEAAQLQDAGAARVVLGASALRDTGLIARLSRRLGPDSVAVALLARREGAVWRVLEASQGQETEWDAMNWAAVAEAEGAAELIVEPSGPGTSGGPFDLELLQAVGSAVRKPVLAGGPALSVEDLFDALMIGTADGVIVGELLHSGRVSVAGIRSYLAERGLGESSA